MLRVHSASHLLSPAIRVAFFMFIAGLLALSQRAAASDPLDEAVMVSASVQSVPPQIQLSWPAYSRATGYTVYRKTLDAGSWGIAIGTLNAAATSFTDAGVSAGMAYEYKVQRPCGTTTGFGYVASGIALPLVENRGTVIFLVDNTYATQLTTELDRMMMDLVGDGWTVLRRDVARTATVASVKALVDAEYAAAPSGVKALYIFGHVPIQKSGWLNPDGHFSRPFPADQYYGIFNGSWTDVSNFGTGNITGDGIFDQSYPPAPVTLQIGRVDLWNLSTFDNTRNELERLRTYLNKDHNYRMKAFAVQPRAFIDDNFGTYGEGFAQNGWRLASFFGANNVQAGNWTDTALTTAPFHWGYGCGGGSYTSASGVATTADMLTRDPAVFTMLFGSYFGEWDAANDLMRAELATPSFGLTCAWAGRPNWFFHRMGIGEPIGESVRLTQNNSSTYSTPGYSALGLHAGFMGDPTLRQHIVAPPGTPTALQVGSKLASLTWTPSSDAVLGYHVYRASSPQGPYTRLTTSLLTGSNFSDAGVPFGNVYYMVRAVKLETGSGTYYNASQGAFASLTMNPLYQPDLQVAPVDGTANRCQYLQSIRLQPDRDAKPARSAAR